MQIAFLYNVDLYNTYIFHIIFMMEDVLKQCLRREITVTWHVKKTNDLDSFLQVTVLPWIN